MSWVKIDKDTFAIEPTPNPVLAVNIADLEQKIEKKQSSIDDLEKQKIKYPASAAKDMKKAVDDWNEDNVVREQEMLEDEKRELEGLLEEIQCQFQ